MKEIKKHLPVAIFSALYIIGATLYFLSKENYEFLLYVGVLIFFFVVVFTTLEKTKFPRHTIWLLSVWGLLHMAGGGLIVKGDVLYTLPIWHIYGVGEWTIFKYDQIVHAFGFFTAAFVVYHLLKQAVPNLTHTKMMFVIVALASMGLGAVNEIIEFVAVITVPDTNVGGYVNTALDLVFNAIGATAASVSLYIRHKK